MKTRIYGETTDINYKNTKNFWENKSADNEYSMRTVLLGSDKSGIAQQQRNDIEANILSQITSELKNLKILDIGCGIGRWANNLYENIQYYDGIDYTEAFIDYANSKYHIHNNNINFYKMSITDMDFSKLSGDYNLIITTGVLMYINDSELEQIFRVYKNLSPKYLYIQESVSLIGERLTLKDFESSELNINYSAIYRTSEEYEKYFKNFDIIKTDLLLNKENGSREETNARWWILRPKKDNQ